MKTYLLALLMILGVHAIFAQASNSDQSPTTATASATASVAAIEWTAVEQNVGEIPQGTPKKVVFQFTNTGTAPLILANVRTSCGCTASNWTKDAILPGESSEIEATYNAKNIGNFNKTITVTSNAATPTVVLKLSGTVVAKENE